MEEKREDTHQQLQIGEEKPSVAQHVQEEQSKEMIDACDEDKQEERVIPMLEENQLLDGTREVKDRDGEGIFIAENQVLEAEKVGERQIDPAKKPKQGSRQSIKAKPTIPQPFTLSTEKRMSKERRGSIDFSSESMKRKPKERHGSMDFKNSYPQPRIYRSASLNHKDQSLPIARETLKTSSKPQVTAAEHVEKGIGKTKDRTLPKGPKSKQLKGNDKKQRVEGMETGNLQKSATFKALPLPRFYQNKRDSPPQSETKKKPEINPKSPSIGQRNFPRSLSKAESNKIEDKGKRPSKTITNGAKETISKLLKGTRKVLNTSKVATKGIVASA